MQHVPAHYCFGRRRAVIDPDVKQLLLSRQKELPFL
jgi:hypothetical protein